MTQDFGDPDRKSTTTSVFVLLVLLLVLQFRLFGALLSALATYSLYSGLVRSFGRRLSPRLAKAAALVSTLVALIALGLAIAEAVQGGWARGGVPRLLGLLADTLERLHSTLPPWLSSRLPDSTESLQRMASGWLRSNAQELQKWGQSALRVVAHVVLGIIVGLLCAFERRPEFRARWAEQTRVALANLSAAFSDIVTAQVRIAAANAALTAVFILAILPLTGVRLPLAPTLIALTFLTGLVPIVGNLVSNAAIVLVALTVSPAAALAAIVFLLAIHKLEYILNAHFVGERTSVPAPVLVASMLVFEAVFGLAGLVAAPIYCAWVFRQFDVIRPRTGMQPS